MLNFKHMSLNIILQWFIIRLAAQNWEQKGVASGKKTGAYSLVSLVALLKHFFKLLKTSKMNNFLKICFDCRLKFALYTCFLGIIRYNSSLHVFEPASYLNHLHSSFASVIAVCYMIPELSIFLWIEGLIRPHWFLVI